MVSTRSLFLLLLFSWCRPNSRPNSLFPSCSHKWNCDHSLLALWVLPWHRPVSRFSSLALRRQFSSFYLVDLPSFIAERQWPFQLNQRYLFREGSTLSYFSNARFNKGILSLLLKKYLSALFRLPLMPLFYIFVVCEIITATFMAMEVGIYLLHIVININ